MVSLAVASFRGAHLGELDSATAPKTKPTRTRSRSAVKLRCTSKGMESDYDMMVYRARVLSSPTRLDVWTCIGDFGMYSTAIARTLDLAPSTVSYHLRVLEHAGLVRHVQQGRYRMYTWTGERWGVVSAAEVEAGLVT